MDAHRPDELTPQRHRPSHRTDRALAPVRQRRDTITDDRLALQIDELEQDLRRDDPALVQRFHKLQRARTHTDVAVFSLLAAAAVLLAIALATTSPVAGSAGVAAYVASFGIYHRHLRKLHRPSTPAHEASPVAVTAIQARCRRCRQDFHLFEVLDQRDGTCPRCGWRLSHHWTATLLEQAARADIAQRHLVDALGRLRNLPGNVLLRPHIVLRNLFEEVGWDKDLAEDSDTLQEELSELRPLLAAWELLDP